MALWKLAGAVVMPNVMTNHSYYPYLVVNAVFSTASSAILIYQYPEHKSKVENTFTPANLSIKSYILGIGYLSFFVTAFKSLKSVQKCKLPSGFLTNNTGAA